VIEGIEMIRIGGVQAEVMNDRLYFPYWELELNDDQVHALCAVFAALGYDLSGYASLGLPEYTYKTKAKVK